MFTSLELGRDEKDLQAGGLSLKKNPLLVSIIDGCETLKALNAKKQITGELVAAAKAIILMRTDKVSQSFMSASRAHTAIAGPTARVEPVPGIAPHPMRHAPADWVWHFSHTGIWPDHDSPTRLAVRMVGGCWGWLHR